MSIYTQCSKAARALLDAGEVFTEIDVVRHAAPSSGDGGWSNANFKAALRDANQVMGNLYRARKVARYGPVKLPDGTRDYARMASKVVYANPETGPKTYKTPNGNFPRLMVGKDEINNPGRRKHTNRNDLVKWSDQDMAHYDEVVPEELPLTGAPVRARVEPSVRIERLEADLAGALTRLEEKDAEINRLREHHANGDGGDLRTQVHDLVLEFLGEFDARIKVIEDRERKRQEVYSS